MFSITENIVRFFKITLNMTYIWLMPKGITYMKPSTAIDWLVSSSVIYFARRRIFYQLEVALVELIICAIPVFGGSDDRFCFLGRNVLASVVWQMSYVFWYFIITVRCLWGQAKLVSHQAETFLDIRDGGLEVLPCWPCRWVKERCVPLRKRYAVETRHS